MKLKLTRVLTPLAALAIAFGAQAALPANEGFEGDALDAAWTFIEGPDGAKNQSAITPYVGETRPDDANRPDAFAGAANNNYLKLATEDGILFRKVNGDAVKTIPETGLYLDTVVQFTVTDKSDRPTPTSEDKFIIWLEAAEDNETKQATTNLCVYAGYLTAGESSFAAAIEKKVYKLAVDGVKILPGSWHRLTVKAVKDIFPKTANYDAAGFQIYIDGVLAVGDALVCPLELIGDKLSEDAAVIEGQNAFPSMVNAAELTLVGFSGEGQIDDVVITGQLPGFFSPEKLTLTWDSTMVTSVTVLDTTYAQSPAVINVEAGQVITLTKADFKFNGAENKYQFGTWEATDEGIVVADGTEADSRTITVGATGSVNLAFDSATKIDVTLNLDAIINVWDSVTQLGYQIGNGDIVPLTEDDLSAPIIVSGVEPGQTVTLVLGLAGYTASLTTDAKNGTVNGLVLTVADTVVENFTATLVLEEPADKVFKVGGTEYTLAEIGTALGASSAANPVTLMADVGLEAAIAIEEGAEAYIDLAGQTLTGAANADVFTIAGALTIKNSGTGGGITAAEGRAIASNIAGTLTIAGAADYVGAITKGTGTINIQAGSFSTNVDATFPTGYGLTENTETGKWVYGARTYTITFNANGGEGSMDAQTYTVETADFTLTANGFTAPTGKKFAGWATTADGEVAYADGASFPVSTAANVTLYAIWEEAAEEYPSYIAEADKAKYDNWVKAYGVTDRADTASANQKAYLLNVAPNATAVKTAEEEFKITSITVNADGSVTVTMPEGKNYNGTVEIRGCETVNGTYTAAKVADKTARFFKAILQ